MAAETKLWLHNPVLKTYQLPAAATPGRAWNTHAVGLCLVLVVALPVFNVVVLQPILFLECLQHKSDLVLQVCAELFC
jgi:hypothetical protein